MASYANLPAPSPEGGLNRYLQEIRRFPMLEPEEEYMLAKRWVEDQDTEAAHKMVTSHLRLAAKIAMGYRGYGLPQAEVISEANVGLMQAVKRFDPEKGFRLATYAMWWIRASIQEYILRSWSLVKLGTTSAQKKLFFNLRKAKAKIGALEDGDLRPENVAQIAHDLNVSEEEVISMNRRLSGGDASLNAMVGSDGDGSTEWQDWLEDEDADQATSYAERDELEVRRELLARAMDVLNDREKDILTQRRLLDSPVTLEELSEHYGVSRERIRQIEVRSFETLQARNWRPKRGLSTPERQTRRPPAGHGAVRPRFPLAARGRDRQVFAVTSICPEASHDRHPLGHSRGRPFRPHHDGPGHPRSREGAARRGRQPRSGQGRALCRAHPRTAGP